MKYKYMLLILILAIMTQFSFNIWLDRQTEPPYITQANNSTAPTTMIISTAYESVYVRLSEYHIVGDKVYYIEQNVKQWHVVDLIGVRFVDGYMDKPQEFIFNWDDKEIEK